MASAAGDNVGPRESMDMGRYRVTVERAEADRPQVALRGGYVNFRLAFGKRLKLL
jgi:hypothetical protein